MNRGAKTEKIEITEDDISEALNSSLWDLGNGVLYSLCQEYPGHEKADEIIAKVWLIGRSYATAIERGKNKGKNEDEKDNRSSDEFYEQDVVNKIKNSEFRIDEGLIEVNSISGGVVVHKQLMDTFQDINGQNMRSLASKYLHFHKPDIFYIYDSRAVNAIHKVTPDKSKIALINVNVFDSEYREFCSRCEWLQGYIKVKFGHREKLTPRQLDKLLLKIAYKLKKK